MDLRLIWNRWLFWILVVGVAAIAQSCGTATGPVDACDCPDTTMRPNGLLSGILDAPLAQVIILQRQQHTLTSDSTYLDIFAGAETRAGRAGNTIDLGLCTVGPLELTSALTNGATLYRYVGSPDDLPSDTTLTIGFSGNASAGIAPYQTSLFVGAPLNVQYNGLQGADVPDTLSSGRDVVITWSPQAIPPSPVVIPMKIIVEIRSASGVLFASYDYSGDDDGRAVIPASDLPDVQVGAFVITILMERTVVRCSCQPKMQYNLASITDQILVRRLR
ncbi:MAG: hypothetical protein ACO3I4_00295 [Candidatus Kapaibacteriota bacterium]